MSGMRSSSALVLIAFAMLASPAPAPAQDGTGQVVTGVVVSGADQRPLSHAMVSLQPVGRQTFSDDQGRFAFIGVPVGRYQLRATHLGFSPAELPIVVSGDSSATRVHIALGQVQVHLAAVHVTAAATCTTPGAPDSTSDREFVAVFQQLELNAQQFRLLADSFPYAYHEQRTTFSTYTDRSTSARRVDTLLLRSDKPEWTYHAGRVVARDGDQTLMHLPILSDFASDEFVKNHCFHFGGQIATLSGPAIRIDFRAADKLRSPDVNGAILLDATSFQISSAELRLSRVPSWMEINVDSVTVTTSFREVEPSVVVLSKVRGAWWMAPWHSARTVDPGGVSLAATIDDQALLDFTFLRGDPRHSVAKP